MKKWNIIFSAAAAVFLLIGGVYFWQKHKGMDRTPPVIVMDSDAISCNIADSEEKLLAGITASDDRDGDLTDSIQVSRIRKKTDSKAVNQFEITYAVFDSSNNLATESRTLTYKDYSPPKFRLEGSLQFPALSSVNLYGYLSAEDSIDGDISSQLAIEMSDEFINATSAGSYSCKVHVTNSVGDTSVLPLTFDVLEPDETRPILYLSQYILYLKKGDSFDPMDYLVSVVMDGVGYEFEDDVNEWEWTPYKYGYLDEINRCLISTKGVSVSSDVSTQKKGVYTVTYSYHHPDAGTNGFVRLMVVVR